MSNQRKWFILNLLAKANQKEQVSKRIGALAESDKSARGHNMLLATELAYPEASMKDKIWQAMTQKSDYSLHEKRAIGYSLYSSDHPELAKPFIKRYFDAVQALHESGEKYEYASYFIRVLFPEIGMEETVIATEKFLATSDVPKTYKTLVMKSLDDLKRTIAVRKGNL